MATKYRVSDSWRNVSNSYIKANGIWKKATAVYRKINGLWKCIEGEDPNRVYYFWPIKNSDEQYNGMHDIKASVTGFAGTEDPGYSTFYNEMKPDENQGNTVGAINFTPGNKYKVSFEYPPAHGYSDKYVYIRAANGNEYRLYSANLINTGIYNLQFTGSSFNIV